MESFCSVETRLRRPLLTGGSGFISAAWRRYRSTLVVVEVALSLLLLTGAGLMIGSVIRLSVGVQEAKVAPLTLSESQVLALQTSLGITYLKLQNYYGTTPL